MQLRLACVRTTTSWVAYLPLDQCPDSYGIGSVSHHVGRIRVVGGSIGAEEHSQHRAYLSHPANGTSSVRFRPDVSSNFSKKTFSCC